MLGSQIKPGVYRSLEGVSVLVTRPSAYAGYLIGEIEFRGGHAIALPTVQVDFTVEDSGLPTLLCPDAERMIAIFTSRNAVCLLYTSPSPRDRTRSRMPSSA